VSKCLEQVRFTALVLEVEDVATQRRSEGILQMYWTLIRVSFVSKLADLYKYTVSGSLDSVGSNPLQAVVFCTRRIEKAVTLLIATFVPLLCLL
jgi:hypothetical protein